MTGDRLTLFGEALLAYGDLLAHPERLPGYDAAVAAIERGEDPTAVPPRARHAPRRLRTAAEIRVSLDRMRAELDRIGATGPDDRAAGMLRARDAARAQDTGDRALKRYARLAERIRVEEYRLARAEARERRAA